MSNPPESENHEVHVIPAPNQIIDLSPRSTRSRANPNSDTSPFCHRCAELDQIQVACAIGLCSEHLFEIQNEGNLLKLSECFDQPSETPSISETASIPEITAIPKTLKPFSTRKSKRKFISTKVWKNLSELAGGEDEIEGMIEYLIQQKLKSSQLAKNLEYAETVRIELPELLETVFLFYFFSFLS